MIHRIYNFSPGPAVLPEEVLLEARENLLSLGDSGVGVLEMWHRSKEFGAILAEAEENMRSLLKLPAGYRLLFLSGGATLQFSMVPMNLLGADKTADYIVTGEWSQRAVKEAQRVGQVHIAGSSEAEKFSRIPSASELRFSPQPAYVHITTNNTIYGTQWQRDPELPSADFPLIADMSSDFLSRPIAVDRYGLIYAGAQKNAGPAGVTLVLMREDLCAARKNELAHLPILLNYRTYLEHKSLYNTPPVFAIYITHLVLRWLLRQGGLVEVGRRNQEKAALIYQAIDAAPSFYRGHAERQSRSLMNITFRLPSADLEEAFAKKAQAQGMVGLAGHRSFGGIRASLYNAFPLDGASALAQFMTEFARQHG